MVSCNSATLSWIPGSPAGSLFTEADIRRLELAGVGYRDSVTASGNMERFDYYKTWVSWHGRLYEIEVFQFIDQPLWDMERLEGNRGSVDARDGGGVIIQGA